MKITGRGSYLGTVIRGDGITDNQAPDYIPLDSKSPNTVKIVEHEEAWYNEEEKKQLKKWYAGEPKKFLKMYFEEDKKIVEDDYHYNQLNFERKNNFEGWTCWAGRTHMKITPSGDIYVGSCHLGGKLGNIFELDSSILPTGPLTCTKWRCTDNLDIRVPKAMPGYEHLVEPYVTKVIEGL
jgi:MoaA/NifB/PqqE/SkfB family radical SAM enzyme